ncbi:MAG TPA: KH domain-containing protein [Trebonia sp.]|nr:KH domain-containing protein [Trebonia sp.]
MTPTIDIILDLRESRQLPGSASDFLSLWAEVEQRMAGASLQGSPSWQIDTPTWGPCGLLLADPAAAPGLVTEETPFVVRSVLEPPRLVYKCATCQASGHEEYGPFTCHACRAEKTADRVCDQHVILLDGGFRASCPRHRPVCPSCGNAASFWCRGPKCKGTTAHCDRHRRSHPGDQAISYCPECYGIAFPACGHQGCTATGSLACGFVDQGSLRRCGARACGYHAFRWQVLGPRKRGPVLCPDHKRALATLSREQLVFQIVATACTLDGPWAVQATRGGPPGRRPPSGPELPRLSVVRHIFLNTRNEALPISRLNLLFTQRQRALAETGFEGRMRRALERRESSRQREVDDAGVEQEKGLMHFARLQQALSRMGKYELANGITFSDFRNNTLRVYVPAGFEGQFFGKQGTTIKGLSRELGVTVRREEK